MLALLSVLGQALSSVDCAASLLGGRVSPPGRQQAEEEGRAATLSFVNINQRPDPGQYSMYRVLRLDLS